jgi:flagellar basal-body rod protein FlgC
MSLMQAMNVAAAGMYAQSVRLATTTSNLANANSVTSSTGQPYRAHEVVFAAQPVAAGGSLDSVRVAGVVASQQPFRNIYEPGNPLANAAGYVQESNVNPIASMVDMISASRAYQDNVTAATVLKTVALKTLSI